MTNATTPALGRLLTAVLFLGGLASGGPSAAQTSPTEPGTRLAVGGVGPGGLAILEAAAFSTVARVDALAQVHGSAISPDGRLAYALNMVDRERAGTVVEVVTDGTACYVAVAPDGSGLHVAVRHPHRLLVGNRAPGSVTPVDPGSMTVLGSREVTPMLTHLLALPGGTLPASGGAAREVLRLDPGTLDVLSERPCSSSRTRVRSQLAGGGRPGSRSGPTDRH